MIKMSFTCVTLEPYVLGLLLFTFRAREAGKCDKIKSSKEFIQCSLFHEPN